MLKRTLKVLAFTIVFGSWYDKMVGWGGKAL